MYFAFKLVDGVGGDYVFTLDSKYMFLTGDLLEDSKDKCFVPVFDHNLGGAEDSNTVIMGNLMLSKYYMVYDMSPLEPENGKDYI